MYRGREMNELIRGYYRPIDIQRFEFIIRKIPERVETILDVGAWDNQFKVMLESPGFQVVAVDLESNHPDVSKANITSLPFGDNSFDLIMCLEVIEHLDKEEMFLALGELERVTKKYIIISVPNSEIPLGVGHKQFFNDKKVENLFNCKNVEIYHFGKRLAYQGIRKYLCRIDQRLLYVYNKIFGEKKGEIDNWIIGIFQLK